MTEQAREYGQGMYALAKEENIASHILAQMQTLIGCFQEQKEFLRLLSNMALPKAERLAILDSAMAGQVHPYLLNFLKILLERNLLMEYQGCVSAFRELYHQDEGIVVAHVTTGAPLSQEQRQRIEEKLKAMTGRQVELSEKVDPAVLGGVLLEMDGKRYDNTLKGRLHAIHQAMIGRE
ncbi:MAG: ATP synthase F1 subunit delta [Clostridiales bacterium]|nr:ATP synthase F1 subunit delta [Clostridiales bacterium]